MIRKLETYVDDVISGKVAVGRFEKMGVERFVKDRERADLEWKEKPVKRVFEFFENYLHHTTGRWKGKPFKLSGWQAFILANLFGFERSDGGRRFRMGFVSVGRKNGKSTLGAGISLYCLAGDREARPEVYSAATKRDQAKLVFDEACRMVRSSADLRRYVKVLTGNLSVPETFGKFEPLGADTDRLDGLNIHCAIVDELHAHKDRNLWDVLVTGTGARENPMVVGITTSGFDKQSFCWGLQEYGQGILEGRNDDDAFFTFIATLDDGDDFEDEANWRKSNPNIGVTVLPDDLREEVQRVKNDPMNLNAFLRYRMNTWTSAESAWITAPQWEACNQGPVTLESLRGRSCVVGLDLAATKDTTALVLVFAPDEPEGIFTVLPIIMVPGGTIMERERKERVPWLLWQRQGYVTLTTGDATDPREVIAKLRELDGIFDIGDLAYDPYGLPQVIPLIREAGWSDDPEKDVNARRFIVQFRQGYRSMSPAIKEVETMVLNRKINHGGNPVLSWMIGCCKVVTDAALNFKLDKSKSTGHIDGPVAMAMALYHAKTKPVAEPSVYETRGLLIF
jgi:phage terminase large subunit-like protein